MEPQTVELLHEEQLRRIAQAYNVPAERRPLWSKNSERQLQQVLYTARHTESTGSQSSAAIATLCSILQSQKDDVVFQELLWGGGIWLQCFRIYLAKLEFTRSKAARSFLNLLVGLLQRQDTPSDTKKLVLSQIIPTILSHDDRGKVKSALSALGHLMTKQVVNLEELVPHFTDRAYDHGNADLSRQDISFVIRKLLRWAQFHELAPVVGHTASVFWKLARTQICLSCTTQPDEDLIKEDVCWIDPLLEMVRQYPESIARLRSHVFSTLFIIDIRDYAIFLKHLRIESIFGGSCDHEQDMVQRDQGLLLTSLQVGNELGLVQETDTRAMPGIQISDGKIILSCRVIKNLLLHSDGAVRLAGFSLLAASPSKTKPLSATALKFLQRALPLLFSETDASIRGQFLGLISNLLVRLISVIKHYEKPRIRQNHSALDPDKTCSEVSKSASTPDHEWNHALAKAIVDNHHKFLHWLLLRSTQELRPESGYQRQIFALEVVKMAFEANLMAYTYLDSNVNQASLNIFALARLLADLTMNAYEDIRGLSASLLKNLVVESGTISYMAQKHRITEAYQSAILLGERSMLSSGRADHADGYGLLFALPLPLTSDVSDQSGPMTSVVKLSKIVVLLDKLENALAVARKNIDLAISTQPLHGTLLALKYILDDESVYLEPAAKGLHSSSVADGLIARTIDVLHEIWNLVHDVLCNDAPEGHVPADVEDNSALTYKDILSYSWRALKEVSGAIQVLMSRTPISNHQDKYGLKLSQDDFGKVNRLSFQALAELRHRGAFSAVAQAFNSCCTRAVKEGQSSTLRESYENALKCINSRGASLTRRSAGIPSMMIGILCSNSESVKLATVMSDLSAEAQKPSIDPSEGGDLPQVHALNCLKAIFTNATLGRSSEYFIPMGLELAGKCLSSDIWAIRNCGLMLFRSLMDRLLGSTESQNQSETGGASVSKISWNEYPALQSIVFQLMEPVEQSSSKTSAIESVFPAFKIIQRVPPPDDRRLEVMKRVLEFKDSTHWHVRVMAARTYASLLTESDNVCELIQNLFERDGDASSNDFPMMGQNRLHGSCLTAFHCLQKFELSDFESLHIPIDELLAFFDSVSNKMRLWHSDQCAHTQSAVLDVITLLRRIAAIRNIEVTSPTLMSLFGDYFHDMITNPRTGPMLRKAAILAHIFTPSTRKLVLGYLADISIIDSDACVWVLQDISSCLLLMQESRQLSKEFLSDIVWVCGKIINATDSPASTSAQAMLSEALAMDVSYALVVDLKSEKFQNIFLGSQVLIPSRVEAGLLLWSQLWSITTFGSQKIKECLVLIHVIRSYLHESMPFTIRLSGTKAMNQIYNVLQVETTENRAALRRVRLEYLLLLYDVLNDDDEEIRDLAASITNKAITVCGVDGKHKGSTIPLAARIHLSAVLASSFPSSKRLATTAILRMTGSKTMRLAMSPTASARVALVQSETNDLFAVERQNLYMDPIRESDIWSKVLRSIHPSTAQLGILHDWTLQGLEAMTALLPQQTHGWISFTSKPDVFVFIWQLLNSAQVLLILPWFSPDLAARSRLMTMVAGLQQVCDHPIVQQKAENIMKAYVISRLSTTAKQCQKILATQG